jgi:hypothetical protein
MRRWWLVLSVILLVGCSDMRIESFEGSGPEFRPERYFLGPSRAWGFFQDRFGKVRRQFTVDIDGRMEGEVLVLDERFAYADGERATRVWRIRRTGADRYEGQADDIVGTAQGQVAGQAMNWTYDIDLAMQGRTWRVHFDDWMLLQDEEVMLNKSRVTKLGIELGEVFIFFRKLSADGSARGDATLQPTQHAAE